LAIPEFVVGEVVRLSVTFTDITDEPVDPDTVVLKVRLPDATTETFEGGQITNDNTAEGAFYMDYVTTLHGDYKWRWEGTENVIAAVEGLFSVKQSVFE
jgi:hypothetical protein